MKTRGLAPNSRRHRLGNLDRRTHESKLFESFRAELLEHIGGKPSVVQAAIIERCAWIKLQCAMMDGKLAAGRFTEADSHCYLAWANTLARLLSRLGIASPTVAEPPQSPGDAIAALKLKVIAERDERRRKRTGT